MVFFFTVTLLMSATILLRVELVMMAQLRIAVSVISFLGSTLSGYVMIYFLLRLRQAPPVLKADSDGLHWDVSIFNRGFAPWNNIDGYSAVRHAGSTYLLAHLKDPFDTIDRQGNMVKRFLQANLKRFQTPIAIPAAYVDGDAAQLLQKLSDFAKSQPEGSLGSGPRIA